MRTHDVAHLTRLCEQCPKGWMGAKFGAARAAPIGKNYWLEIVAVVPSNLVMLMVNGSL